MPHLVLLRHGQSHWNAENLFTGWYDVDLTDQGEDEARAAGRLLAARPASTCGWSTPRCSPGPSAPPTWPWTTAGRSWLPVRRHWRLNERHYGALQGLNKKETDGPSTARTRSRSGGAATPRRHRRSSAGSEHDPAGDPRYRDVPADALPLTECLADVVARIAPLLGRRHRARPAGRGARGGAVLVVAHGNSLRALRKHIEGISDDEIVDLEIPTGIPYRYRLADDLSVVSERVPRGPGRGRGRR